MVKLERKELIKRMMDKIKKEGNGDKVYMDWVESKIKKAIPTDEFKSIDAIRGFRKVMADDDVEYHTPTYLLELLDNSLNDYLVDLN